MTIGFMAVYVALLSEHLSWPRRIETPLLVAAAALGLASVVYWSVTDDLRLYFAVQAMSLLSALLLILRLRDTRQQVFLLAAFGSYALAILCEQHDYEILSMTGGAISGHTIKHLFAALAPFWIYRMLKSRQASDPRPMPAAA